MKQLIYSALIGSLALAFSAQAADEKKPQKKAHAGRGAPSVQKVQGTAHGPAQANIHGSANAMHAQPKAMNPGRNHAAIVHENKMQSNGASALRHSNVNATAMQHNAAKIQQQNVTVNPQQNVAGNRFANLKPKQHRQVALVNNWSGSHFSGEQYSAFRNYRRELHDRSWYQSRYPRIVVFGGGNYYWNNGYWYPAWGYDSGYRYGYDGPIYGYNDLNPDQVVVNVQTQLQQAGYYDGPIDGSIGPITRRAIAAFQADQGLAVTSAIDRPTLETLGLI